MVLNICMVLLKHGKERAIVGKYFANTMLTEEFSLLHLVFVLEPHKNMIQNVDDLITYLDILVSCLSQSFNELLFALKVFTFNKGQNNSWPLLLAEFIKIKASVWQWAKVGKVFNEHVDDKFTSLWRSLDMIILEIETDNIQ